MPANEPGALWMPNGNAWSGRNGLKPRYVILHGTAGGSSAENTAAYFKSTEGSDNPVSSHYIIGRDGTVIQCIDEADSAWANGVLTTGHDVFWDPGINPNLLTISIEHLKPSSDNSDSLTEPQRASSFALVKHICQRWSIPARAADASGGITGHYSIDPVNRSRCPGPYPFDALYTYLKGGIMTGVPAGWKDDGKTLTAPNNFVVTDGFREWVLAHTWDSSNIPWMNAAGLNPVEQGNPSLGGGTVQPFHRTVLVWTAKTNVYEMQMGQEYVALHQVLHKALIDLNASQAQVKALQAQLLAAQNSLPLVNDYKVKLTQIHNLSNIQEDFIK